MCHLWTCIFEIKTSLCYRHVFALFQSRDYQRYIEDQRVTRQSKWTKHGRDYRQGSTLPENQGYGKTDCHYRRFICITRFLLKLLCTKSVNGYLFFKVEMLSVLKWHLFWTEIELLPVKIGRVNSCLFLIGKLICWLLWKKCWIIACLKVKCWMMDCFEREVFELFYFLKGKSEVWPVLKDACFVTMLFVKFINNVFISQHY